MPFVQGNRRASIRALISILGIIIDTIILGIVTIIVCPVSGNLAFHVVRLWARIVLRVSGVKVIVLGQENILRTSPQIFMANHQSLYDVPALFLALPVQLRFVAKKELVRVPIFGWAMSLSGHIVIDRAAQVGALRIIERSVKRIKREKLSVCVFPEGSMSWDGSLQPFKRGTFVLAMRTGIPVVPIWISGAREVLPRGRLTMKPGTIRLMIGEPLDTSSYVMENKEELMDRVRKSMIQLKKQEACRDTRRIT